MLLQCVSQHGGVWQYLPGFLCDSFDWLVRMSVYVIKRLFINLSDHVSGPANYPYFHHVIWSERSEEWVTQR